MKKKRKLFCEISPFTYKISERKEIIIRQIKNAFDLVTGRVKFAVSKSGDPLSVKVFKHKSLIRRKLGNVDMTLQENKAHNLSLIAPKIDGIYIYPGETFSFWKLAGAITKKKGFLPGLIIKCHKTDTGIGGGMCQMTNLIHFLVLHSPLTIIERHHHNNFDLFPDFGRQVPFGVGTSILYNYLDYRFRNDTDIIFKLEIKIDDTYLCGKLFASKDLPFSYHIKEKNARFVKQGNEYYRQNEVIRQVIDKHTGDVITEELISEANALVMYDASFISSEKLVNKTYDEKIEMGV
ncbi:MAG: VanW family protein [Ruminococcus sp.]|jgi:vancomycin resistance protein VanW|nr:VanW family protein [Ruminococcus sp.]